MVICVNKLMSLKYILKKQMLINQKLKTQNENETCTKRIGISLLCDKFVASLS